MESEDTQATSKADAAAVKRKRRSSILKNQRPPRTPFSEVEFNVATPPDTTKSRRVSFSRRTGVAEFVTNEATTTWRNFYEEHNKSLELSGNENHLLENAPRQTIEHIGKRMFDQQFEEVEAVDVGGTIHTNPLQQFQASFDKINLTQELASIGCMTGELKFVPSQSKFEQSVLTELSKPFGNDIQCPVLEDMTNPISMNFSTMQPLSASNCDDLDEIQNDLERSKPSAMCPGPMNPGKDFSGYIEVADLDVTHGAIYNDGSEMSITDTIESPKVQDAKNSVQQSNQKVDDDWTNDKENMVFNPYVAPKESLTFAVNKVSDEVLVFDGKRLTTQSITSNISENKENFRHTLLPNAPANAPQRKTIILDVNDDLPNFIDNNSSKTNFNLHASSMQPTDTITVNVQNNTDTPDNNKSMANNTIDICDTSNILSFTQAISSNIIAAKRESLYAKDCNDIIQDISMTQPVPNSIVETNPENKLNIENNGKRKTIIFVEDSCDISMTQALPTNINFIKENEEKNNDIIDDKLVGNNKSEKRRTIIFDKESCDISMTQALPTNIDLIENLENKEVSKKGENKENPEKRRTIIFSKDSCDISMTQALPTNLMENLKNGNEVNNKVAPNEFSEKRRTIIFDKESCDISMTQALPTNINFTKENQEIKYNIFDDKLGNNNSEKRRTIIFDKESCDISMTQALPTNINLMENFESSNEVNIKVAPNEFSEKRRTIIFDKESCDISVTQALPTNIDLIENLENNEVSKKGANKENPDKRRTIIFSKDSCDISMTQALPTNINLMEYLDNGKEVNNKVAPNEFSEKRRTIIFDKESCDISVTQALPTNIDPIENLEKNNEVNKMEANKESPEKRRTIIFRKDSCDISMTQALPTNINLMENCESSKEVNNKVALNEKFEKRRTIIFDKESCDISLTQALPTNIDLIDNLEQSNENNKRSSNDENQEKRKTIIFDKNSCDVSMTQALPTNINLDGEDIKRHSVFQEEVSNEISIKRKSTIFDHESCDISMTQAFPTNFYIFKESGDKDESNMKLELKNRSDIIYDYVSDQITPKIVDNSSNKSETKECKNISQLSPAQKVKTITDYDNNRKSSDHYQIEQHNISGKTNKTDNHDMEVTDFGKTIQANIFLQEEIKNVKPDISLSNSINHKNLDVIEQCYSNLNKSKMDIEGYINLKFNIDGKKDSLVNKTSDYVNIQNDVLPDFNIGNNNKIMEHRHDENSQYLVHEPEFKTNVSVYQVYTSEQANKTSTNACNDEFISEMDVDSPVKLSRDKTINNYLEKNTSMDNKPKKSILDELLSMSSDSIKQDLSQLCEKDDTIHDTEKVKEDSILMSTSKETNWKESSLVESKSTQNTESQPVVNIKNNDSLVFMKNLTNETHMKSNNESHAQFKSNVKKDPEDKDHTKFNMELEESLNLIPELNSPKTLKSVKEADNTKDLLKMLSDITDEDGEESRLENFNTKVEDCEKLSVAEKNTVTTKGTLQEPKRLSLAPRRQSIAISREDLLNNISMAKAALQQSRFEVDETDIMDDTSELIETYEINDTNKSNRMSSEVVKTLQFQDESTSDTSIKSEVGLSPLRKSVVDENISISDMKVKVIPTFLTDVSALKEIMHELVKPNSDTPLENNYSEKSAPSTCNAEVETNFIASSQIDVSREEISQCILKNSDNFVSKVETKDAGIEVDSMSILTDIKSSVTDYEHINIVQHSTDVNTKNLTENIVKCNVHNISQSSPQKSKRESIVFNTENPLKNINLPPIDYSDAHRYNERGKKEDHHNTQNKTRQSSNKMEVDEKSISLRSFVNDALKDKQIAKQMNIVCGKTASEGSSESSLYTNVYKPTYADKSIESVEPSRKDTEVNTMIVMNKNTDLIQSSSLTLVEEKLMDSEYKMNIGPSTEPSSEEVASSSISHVKILFSNETDAQLTEKYSGTTLSEEISNIDLDVKTRKRSYSPTSTNSHVLSNVEVTPKPISKMQKMSNSPLTKSTINKISKDIMQVDLDQEEIKSLKNDESKIKSTAHTEIIQAVEIQHCNKSKGKHGQISHITNVDEKTVTEHKESLKQWSLASDNAIQDPSVTISQVVSSVTSSTPLEEKRDSKIIDPGPDVIENIKQLSFMGTPECEWERCGRADTWAFRLLCGRVRLRVRLHGGAVRADTPVTAVDLEVAKADEKDEIAALCVSLAMEAMRYEVAEVSRADAVAVLLRRCVRVTRLARRWARAMRDAHARLAYRVLPDGHISLKVANLPLRRVVEARLHVSLAVGREHGAAYPCADGLALGAGGAAGAGAAGAELARLADQPPDWGHVPRTIWKVFKYLKNRTRQEEFLGL